MAENEMGIAELWELVEKDNAQTRQAIQQSLDDVRSRLDRFLTKDQFAAEKAILELRLERAERDLRDLDAKHSALEEKIRADREVETQRKEAERQERERQDRERREELRSNLLFKVAVPVLLVLLPLLMALWSPLK